MYNEDLYNACEFAKFAADMTIPVEAKPTPEPGTQIVQGMADGSMYNPASVGDQTYAGAVDAAALAKAKEKAALVAAKTASIQDALEDAYYAGMTDGAYDAYSSMDKTASAYYGYGYGYRSAEDEYYSYLNR